MQRRLRAAAYTPQGADALALFRSYDKHSTGGLSLPQFRAVVRKGAKTSEEDLDDHELVKLWKLLLANGGATDPPADLDSAGGTGRGQHARTRRPMLSSSGFVAFVHGEQKLDLLQCCATTAKTSSFFPGHFSLGRSPSPLTPETWAENDSKAEAEQRTVPGTTPVRPNTTLVTPKSGGSSGKTQHSRSPLTASIANVSARPSHAPEHEPPPKDSRPRLDGKRTLKSRGAARRCCTNIF